ncbi:hypothetical protein F4779DRAFT_584603 [Xylariaceae sp. FL0662B]|nr:hypothetical protein F4779DRAFT_584603 [Xylariaceae sp. FL0662B]
MSTGGAGGYYDYAASEARRKSLGEQQIPKGAAEGSHTGEEHRGIMETLKEALRPGDARKFKTRPGDSAPNHRRRSSVDETMMLGRRDSGERPESPSPAAASERATEALESATDGPRRRESYHDARTAGGEGGEAFDSMLPGRRPSPQRRGSGLFGAFRSRSREKSSDRDKDADFDYGKLRPWLGTDE